jgi:hypothetical protein
LAAKNGHFKMVKIILPQMQAEQIEVALPNGENKTAADLAKENRHQELGDYLDNAFEALLGRESSRVTIGKGVSTIKAKPETANEENPGPVNRLSNRS